MNPKLRYAMYTIVWSSLLLSDIRPSDGALVISVDADPTLAGIQNSRTVAVGDTFDVEIVFDLTDLSTLSSYTISARFDAAGLNFVSGSDTSAARTEFPIGDNSVLPGIDNDSGQTDVDLIDGASFPGRSAPLNFIAASLRFTAQQPASVNPFTIAPGTFGKPLNGTFDSGFGEFAADYRGALITISAVAVPEPSSLLLLSLVCFAGLAVLPRRADIGFGNHYIVKVNNVLALFRPTIRKIAFQRESVGKQ